MKKDLLLIFLIIFVLTFLVYLPSYLFKIQYGPIVAILLGLVIGMSAALIVITRSR